MAPTSSATIYLDTCIAAGEREGQEEGQEEPLPAGVLRSANDTDDQRALLVDGEFDTLRELMESEAEQDGTRAVVVDASRASVPMNQRCARGAATTASTAVTINKVDLLREEERLANDVLKDQLEGDDQQRTQQQQQHDQYNDTSGVLRDSVQGIPGAFACIGGTDIDPTLQGDDVEAQQQQQQQQQQQSSEPHSVETVGNQPNMPVADLVAEQSIPTTEAQPVEPGQNKGKQSFTILISISLVVVLCAIILAVVFAVTRGNDAKSSTASVVPANNASQPDPSTQTPLPMYEQVLRLLPDETVKNIEVALGELSPDDDNWWSFQTSNFSALTPQQKAYQWVLQDPSITSFGDQQIVQRFALATFYHATGGPNWRNSDEWLSYQVHECDWYHTNPSSPDDSPDIFNMPVANDTVLGRSIPCNDDSLYEFLRLKENNLDGTLPMELLLLSNLKGISLEDQNIHGTIPSHIEKLSRLEEWFMYNTALTGSIPTEVGLLTNMLFLNLFLNMLTGSIPSELGLIPDTHCSFSSNQLTGSLPTELGLMRDLPWVHENSLTGTLPTELQNMPNLTKLYLHSNNLSGTLPPQLFLRSTELEELWISVNNFSGPIPSEIGVLTKLHSIFMTKNSFSGALPSEVGRLEALTVFRLGKTKMSSTLPTEFGLLKNLFGMHIPKSGFFGPLPSELFALNTLNAFNALGNDFSSTLPTELGGFSNLKAIVSLNGNNFTGPIPSELGLLRFAKNVDFSGNGFTGTLPTELGNLRSAAILDLSRNRLSGLIPSQLGLLDSFTDIFSPVEKPDARNISEIKLWGNILTGPVPSSLGSLSMLNLLELYNNTGLTGEIPTSLCDLETWPAAGGIKVDCDFVDCMCNATCLCS